MSSRRDLSAPDAGKNDDIELVTIKKKPIASAVHIVPKAESHPTARITSGSRQDPVRIPSGLGRDRRFDTGKLFIDLRKFFNRALNSCEDEDDGNGENYGAMRTRVDVSSKGRSPCLSLRSEKRQNDSLATAERIDTICVPWSMMHHSAAFKHRMR